MTEHSSASIRQPKDWQDFERNCCILFECLLDDPSVKSNGTSGQSQDGVDIYGRQSGKGTAWVGIQCKKKKPTEKIKKAELRKEVEKAKKFTPALGRFIVVTTAQDDAVIDAEARQITQEHEQSGISFTVEVWGWETLERKINAHHKALEAFQADATPYSSLLIKNTEYLVGSSDAHTEQLKLILQSVQGLQQPTVTDGTSAALELLDKTLHAQIDGYRDLLNQGKPLTALNFLESLKSTVWETVSDRIKFRIITNIGSAKLHISKEKEQEAIEHFFEAIQYQPEDKIALANVALAHLLKGEVSQAVEAAKEALAKNPENTEAASYLIQAHIKDANIDNPVTLISEAIRESSSVDIACINFYRMREDTRWVDIAKAAAKRHPDNEHIIRFAAEAELDVVLATKGFLTGQRANASVDMDALRQAASTLQKLWEKQYNSEIPYVDSSLPHNLAQTYRALGDKVAAKNVTVQAIEKMPDACELINLRASFYLEDSQPEEALTLLKKNNTDPESILMSAEILLQGDPVASLEMLKDFDLMGGLEDHHIIMAGQLRVDSLLSHPRLSKEERSEGAAEQVKTLLQQFPNNPLVSLLRSQVLEALGDDAGARQALIEAKELLKEESVFFERFMLAKRFEELEEYANVADVLDGYVDAAHDSPALRTLFFALVNSDRRGHGHALLQSIPDHVKNQPVFLRAAISLHFRRGDYTAAEDAINRLLLFTPNDLRTHLNRVDIWLRHRDDESLKKFLSTPVEKLEGSPEEKMRLAHLLDRYDLYQRALVLGYKTHLENPRNPQVQLAYIGLLLRPGSSDKINLQRTVVGPDTAFSVRNSSGEIETFIIEETDGLRLADEAVAPAHPFAVAATGLKEGDRFSFKEEEWFITSVKHKFLHLLHSRMDRFERHFPDHRGLQRFVFRTEEGEEESFEPMLRKIKEKHDSSEEILNRYVEFPLPLEVFAEYLGADVIEAWHGLTLTGKKFKVCNGTLPERDDAQKCIEKNGRSGCVVDALTLHIIRAIGMEEAVATVCGPISMTESSIDTFRLRREQVQSHGGKPFMTVFWKDGHYFREETTSEQLEQALAKIDSELDWLDQNVIIIPAESKESISDDAQRLRDALSYSFLDPILAAQGAAKLLLCEDQSYRQFGRVEFKIGVSWLQPVLMVALDQGVISREKYCEAICNLFYAGHDFTSIDIHVLSHALTKGDEVFEKISKALFGENAEINSHLKVMVAYLHTIWSGDWPSLDEQKATSTLLRRLFFGEWTQNVEGLSIQDLSLLIPRLFKNSRFTNYFAGWLKGHFLPPFIEDK